MKEGTLQAPCLAAGGGPGRENELCGQWGGKKIGELPSKLYLGEEVAGLNQQRDVEDLP